MTRVTFYEKPGCATNARQRLALERAGHTVLVRDLLKEPWTAARLLRFFGDTPVSAWFNKAAPRVTDGTIVPEEIDADTALREMLADPRLIRRPLVFADDRYCAGFDRELITSLLERTAGDGLEGCSHPHRAAPCPPPCPTAQPDEGRAA